MYLHPPSSGACTDTPGWTNTYQATCNTFVVDGHCTGNGFAVSHEWAAAAAFGSAGEHCCVCGKDRPAHKATSGRHVQLVRPSPHDVGAEFGPRLVQPRSEKSPTLWRCTLPPYPPLVSLIVLTCNRPGFLDLALDLAAAQTYPNLEVVIVDDSSDSHAIERSQLLRRHGTLRDKIRLVQLAARSSIGAKRNAGVRAARGTVLLHWDDDDLHPPGQVEALACPIVTNRSELAALGFAYLAKLSRLRGARFYEYRGAGPFLGSLAFHRSVAEALLAHPDAHAAAHPPPPSPGGGGPLGGPFADVSLSEDLGFVERALDGCHRMLTVTGVPIVYTRHASVRNTWQVNLTEQMAPSREVPPPSFVSDALRRQYVEAEADSFGRGACVPIRRHAPPDLRFPVRYPYMPPKCCHGSARRHSKTELLRPCAPSASECSTTYCGEAKGECSASCTCPEERRHGAAGTVACGFHCCRFWREWWSEHPGACTSLKATRPLKAHACQERHLVSRRRLEGDAVFIEKKFM